MACGNLASLDGSQPLQHVALDDQGFERLGQLAFTCALSVRPDVDQQRAATQRGGHLVGGKPAQPGAGGLQDLVDATHRFSGWSVNSVRLRRNVFCSVTS